MFNNDFIKMWLLDLFLNIKNYQKYITLNVMFENKVDAVLHDQLDPLKSHKRHYSQWKYKDVAFEHWMNAFIQTTLETDRQKFKCLPKM